MSDTADKISKILEDPESIKMISQIAESFMTNSADSESISQTNSEDSESLKVENTLLNDVPSFKFIEDLLSKADVENSIMLISALRPYMSKHRRESADSVLKVLRILKLINKSNFSEISKLLSILQ